MKDYLIALDGGGTKTDILLLSKSGEVIDEVKWGTTSHEFLEGGMTALSAEIKNMLAFLFQKNDICPNDIAFGVFGMAGVDTVYQQRKISAMIEENGIKNYIVCNDGFLGIKAGTKKGVGINVINGTGCSLTGINENGEMLQLGGQGVVMDDLAGGYVIGRNVVKFVFEDLMLGGESTLLSRLLLEKLQLKDKSFFMDELVRQVGEKNVEIKHLGILMFEAAKKGDAVAKNYLAKTGKELARYICVMAQKLGIANDVLEVVLIGSGFARAADDTLNKTMENAVKKALGADKVVFNTLKIKPVCGAALWALESVGVIDENTRKNAVQNVQNAVLKNE